MFGQHCLPQPVSAHPPKELSLLGCRDELTCRRAWVLPTPVGTPGWNPRPTTRAPLAGTIEELGIDQGPRVTHDTRDTRPIPKPGPRLDRDVLIEGESRL